VSDERAGPTGPNWGLFTGLTQELFYARKAEIIAYGNAPVGYAGNSWIMMSSGTQMFYVLETPDEIAAIIGGA